MPAIVAAQPLIIQPPADLLTRYPQLEHLSLDLARRYAFSELVTDEMLQQMGLGLWAALGIEQAFEDARQQALPAILPISIESSVAEIQLLPWETLYHPQHGFLGKSQAFTLSRRVSTRQASGVAPEKGPLRVLLFTSLPNDIDAETSRLKVEEEQAQVQEALAQWVMDGSVLLEMPDDGCAGTLQKMLRSFQPQLVFLSGHGKFHHEPHRAEKPYGEFLFEDEQGNRDPVRDQDLASMFLGTPVQAVVLSACESGMSASTDLNQGLAAQLSALGIPHVIGMRESVLDAAGIKFARALCESLVAQERIDTALQAARASISKPLAGVVKTRGRAGCLERAVPGSVVPASAAVHPP